MKVNDDKLVALGYAGLVGSCRHETNTIIPCVYALILRFEKGIGVKAKGKRVKIPVLIKGFGIALLKAHHVKDAHV